MKAKTLIVIIEEFLKYHAIDDAEIKVAAYYEMGLGDSPIEIVGFAHSENNTLEILFDGYQVLEANRLDPHDV